MWLILSFANAITVGAQNAYYKKASIQIHPLLLLWAILVISSILFSPLFLFGIPHINNTFLFAVGMRLIIDTLATTLYIKGVQLSPLTLTIPMLSLEPIALIFTQIFINHLYPSALGVVGLLITVFGIYFLNFDHDTKHIFSPFQNIYKEKGVLLVAITAILWSFVVSLQKLGIDNSSPYFFPAFSQLAWALCLTPIVYIFKKEEFKKLFQLKMITRLFPAGAFDAVQLFLQYIAYTMALPVYVIAVTNTNIFFSSFFGWLFYKEKLQKHVIPTIIIIIGITLITFAQK